MSLSQMLLFRIEYGRFKSRLGGAINTRNLPESKGWRPATTIGVGHL